MVDTNVVVPGDVVSSDSSFLLQGHGTYVSDKQLRASYLGSVKHVNQLVYVEPFGGKYVGQIGDIVIGVVDSIQGNKWFLDVNAVELAQLSILQVNTEELANRRKIDEDIYEMSNLFNVNDIVSCEIQRISPTGTIMLQTRTSKYGKLENGILVKIKPNLVIRKGKHIYDMECGVRIILGCNGYIWLTSQKAHELLKKEKENSPEKANFITRVCIIRSILLMFSSKLIKVNFDVIEKAFAIYSHLFPNRCDMDKQMEEPILSNF
ncbi:Exosome complex exonuclease RRP4 N-terminal region family protein [Theileria parva strain Muguga]|uniref:Uncharacterized protein n=1 Tax=Theileria parva TaxID=5875 RepID=Q4N656_THEPA|nr:Exosome complex exonuclease RRP4 N-terminal region family protein [Theileria parva strain Muguga]EAN32367.1 Exosome complex exonuclease RRP4 N-terminal region family protein [Theileria parva strain Muguga]|eukprot:XP_764650.1 hypothetical protein [Theileria parva strain Muguga]